MPGSRASSESSELLFELCDDALDSDEDVAQHEAALKARDEETRSERTWQLEQDVVYGREGMGMPSHNTSARHLRETSASWLPPLIDQSAIEARGLEIEKVAYTDRSFAEFEARHVTPSPEHPHGLPFIAEGAAQHDGWAALGRWQDKESFVRHYAGVPLHITEIFPMGEFGKAYPVRLPAGMYLDYSRDNTVDFPYYPFERDFDSPDAVAEGRAALLRDFTTPKYFQDDVYALTQETRALFPKHKFVLIGGHRTGANMHQDPMGTCAWNTLIAGMKRWVFFPPNTDPSVILTGRAEGASPAGGGVMTMGKVTGKGPVDWWIDVYPLLVAKDGSTGVSLAEQLGMVEVLQTPDQTIYTPPYWFHAVLNVTDFAIAATGNMLSPQMLKHQWAFYRKQYPQDAEILRQEVLSRDLLQPEDLPLIG